MSSIQHDLGLHYESESTAVEGLKILDKLKNNDTNADAKIGLSNHLGIIYNEIGNYDRALEIYFQLLKTTKNAQYLNIIHNNIANVYKKQQKYDLAISEFNKVYSNSLKFSDKKQIARALNNLAFAKSKLNFPEALNNMETALELRKLENDLSGLFSSYITLAEYYKDRNEQNKVMFYANLAYDVSINTNNKLDRVEALSFLVEMDKRERIKEYKYLVDSITNAKQINENKFSYIKYNYNKKEKEAQEMRLKFVQSELEASKEKSKKTIYQFIGLLLVLGLLFLYILLKSKYKKEKLKEVFNTETRISKKIHDEVANDVYHAMIKLQNNANNKEDVLDDLENIYIRTRNISEGISAIDVKTNFNDLLSDLLVSYKSDDVSVIAKNLSAVDWKAINDLKRATVYRVLQELMTNMQKHSKATIVLVAFNQNKKNIIINYTDNGIGCILKKGNGLQNTENRMVSINGNITFDSKVNNSFKATITV